MDDGGLLGLLLSDESCCSLFLFFLKKFLGDLTLTFFSGEDGLLIIALVVSAVYATFSLCRCKLPTLLLA